MFFLPELSQPPYGNTGAERTDKTRVMLDWCGFTVPSENHAFSILRIDKSSFTPLETGAMGYSKTFILGHISVYYDGSVNMGCHVEISGQGCREYESEGIPWWQLVSSVFECGGKFTRIDLALDDFDKRLKLTTMEAKIRRGSVSSIFKKARSLKEYLIEDGSYTGKTLYFGSSTSRVQIRVYDKTLEQVSKGKEDVPDNWVRIEMQCRNERAQSIATYLIFDEGKDLGTLYKQFLSHYLNFLIRRSDSNKRRWPVCEWWTSFLDHLPGLKLTTCPKPRTIETITRWINSQVSPSLALLSVDSDGNLKDLKDVLDITISGVSRLTNKDLEIVKNYEIETKLKKEQLNKIAEKNESLEDSSES